MRSYPPQVQDIQGAGKPPWPYCAALGRTCLAHEVGQLAGRNVARAILTFIASAEEGARLTFQKNRDGFTVQVTEAIIRAEGKSFDLAEVRSLGALLDRLTERRGAGTR